MSTVLDLFDDSSDSEDFDYVPPVEFTEMSEDEAESSDGNTKTEGKNVRKTSDISQVCKVKKKLVEETKLEMPVVDQKQKANDVWKSFLDEVSEVKSESTLGICSEANSAILNNNKKEENDKTAITSCVSTPEKSSELLLAFAGEVVSVANAGCVKPCAKSLSCDFLCSENSRGGETESLKKEDDPSVTSSSKRKGLDSVLNKVMNKKLKNITTLEKTLIDWKSFKKEEGIEEDIEKYNRGRGGYVERQRFLERSDLRRFEIEKAMRLSRTKKS